MHPGSVLRFSGGNPRDIIGRLDAAVGTLNVQSGCGSQQIQLRRPGDAPALAQRVLADLQRRVERQTALASAVKPGRLVGIMPPGNPQQPSCPILKDWAASYPMTLRVRLFDNNNNGILRQFDDENSSRVFGMPAYWWNHRLPNG